jgi:hypothetical protein
MPFKPPQGRIPVTSGSRLLEFADPARAAVLLRAPNVRPILKHKKRLVEIQLIDFGVDCSREESRDGNPQSYTSRAEDDLNPRNVIHFKRIVPNA